MANALVDATPLTTTEPQLSGPGPSTGRSLWRSAWRWHFYGAALVLPVLAVLALSGLVLLLKPTVERTFYGDRLYVDSRSGVEALPFARQLDAVRIAHPDASVDTVVPPRDANRSTQVDITTDSGERSVYVDPYTGELLGSIDAGTRIDAVATRIHGELLLGRWGDWLVEVVAGWGLVMMATGLYLWWPRAARGGGRRAFSFRLREGGRARWRDLHANPSAVFAVVVIFLLLTGLPWSRFWGDRYSRLADELGAGANEPETPVSALAARDLETAGLAVAWGSERLQVPVSGGDAVDVDGPEAAGSGGGGSGGGPQHAPGDTHHEDHGDRGGTGDESPAGPNTALPLEHVTAVAAQVGMRPGYAIGMPADGAGVYSLSNSWPSPAQDERSVFLDQYSGDVLASGDWDRYGLLSKVSSWGVEAHMGRQFGVLNGLLMGGAALAVLGAVVTAPVMYWKRRPRGRTGFPRRPADARLPRGVVVIAVLLGIGFPLLGASMVLVTLVDHLVVRRLPPLRRAFGMPVTRS